MKIGTMSIIVGGRACNANCPFCVSKMTPTQDVTIKAGDVNWTNFKRACRLAEISGVTTVLLTSKGEPTLWPDLIMSYLKHLDIYGFPFIELQTNGIALNEDPDLAWRLRAGGLTTVALSAVSVMRESNASIYSKHYPELSVIIENLHSAGLSVRLTLMMVNGIVSSVERIEETLQFCREHGVEQLTVRPITTPLTTENAEVYDWTTHHRPDEQSIRDIYLHYDALSKFPDRSGVAKVMTLAHGAPVYSVNGQNLCLTDCLTNRGTETEEVRQIIFFPDGHIRYDWQYEGAILL